MEGFANIDVTKKSGLTYMSYKPDDVLRYQALLKDWSGTGKRYDSAYKLLTDIKAPSKDKARQIFDQLWKNDPQYRIELTKTLTMTYSKFLQEQGFSKQQAINMALHQVKEGFDNDTFHEGIYSFVRRGYDSEMLSKKFIQSGYQAIEDYFDKGTLAEAPMILLDAEHTLVKKGEKFVSEAMQNKAIQNLLQRGKIDLFGRMIK